MAEALRGTVCVGVAFDTAWKTYTNGTAMPCATATNSGAQCYVYHYGSGCFFHDSGLILTCEHVRRACRRDINAHAGVLVVCPYKGPTTTLDWSEAWIAEVVAHTAHWDGTAGEPEDPPVHTLPDKDDAAVLRIRKKKSSLSTGVPAAQPITVGGSPLKVLRISETCLQHANHALQELASLGFPPAGGLETATPLLVQFSEILDDTFLKLTGSEMMPGHSGGPLVTMSGVVVGWNVRNRPDTTLYSHCKMIAVARKCIELTLPADVTWSSLLASEDEKKAHVEQVRSSVAAIGAQAAAVAEQGAQHAAGRAEQSAKGAASSATAAAGSAAHAVGGGYAGALQAQVQMGMAAAQQLQLLEGVEWLSFAAPHSGAPLQFGMRTALEPIPLQLPGAMTRSVALAPAVKPKRVVIQTSGDIAAISMPAQREEFESALASELELKLPPDSIELQPDERSVQIARREASIVLSGLTKIERRGVEAFVAEHLAFSAANLRVIPISGSLYLHIAGPAWAMLLLTQLFVAGDDGIRQLLLARGLGEPLDIRVASAQPADAAAAPAEPGPSQPVMPLAS